MKTRWFATLLLLAFALPATAQDAPMPAGKWWHQREIVKRLNLTVEQQARLDEVFRGNAATLIDLRADAEKKSLALREAIDRAEFDRDQIRTAVAQLNEARARMFEREIFMMVEMRSAMSNDQWGKLRAAMDSRRQQGMRPGTRPGAGGGMAPGGGMQPGRGGRRP
jgi:Spy/CpxP family protein refolding chaperone